MFLQRRAQNLHRVHHRSWHYCRHPTARERANGASYFVPCCSWKCHQQALLSYYSAAEPAVVCLLTICCLHQIELNGPCMEAVLAPLEHALGVKVSVSLAHRCCRRRFAVGRNLCNDGAAGSQQEQSGPIHSHAAGACVQVAVVSLRSSRTDTQGLALLVARDQCHSST
jgi:hypothetical protein